MTTIKRLGSSALVASCLAFAPAASAQIIDIGAGVNGGIDVGQVRPTSSANANINVNVTATSSRATTSAPVGATATTSASIGTSTGTSSGSGSVGVTPASGSEALVITRGDVEGQAYEDVAASEVRTSADLDAYARAFVQGDENVSRVSAGADSVSLWYKDRARLLGFIPVTVSAEAKVTSDGTVEVSYPWYRFLTTYNGEGLESDLDSAAGSIARAEGGSELSASAQARVLAAMRAVMSAHYESNIEADADSTSSVEIR